MEIEWQLERQLEREKEDLRGFIANSLVLKTAALVEITHIEKTTFKVVLPKALASLWGVPEVSQYPVAQLKSLFAHKRPPDTVRTYVPSRL